MTYVCENCIGDGPLKVHFAKRTKRTCSYCGNRGPALAIADLAELVDSPLRSHIERGEYEPDFTDGSDRPDYRQNGSPLTDVLQEELEVECDLAADLAAALVDADPADLSDGGEAFFTTDDNYHRRKYPSGAHYYDLWNEFETRIKHSRRYFDDEAARALAEVLSPQDGHPLATVRFGPQTDFPFIYRARRADDEGEALRFLRTPQQELGPPPAAKAVAGRMNPAGIPVFYGALSEATAIAEVRPSVGGLVLVGKFRVVRAIELLDLSRVHAVPIGSIFDPEYDVRFSRRSFLSGFHRLIAKPVQPRDETLEYVPTQAVAEYVANVLGLDGIVYASAQVGSLPDDYDDGEYLYDRGQTSLDSYNAVLFHERRSGDSRTFPTEIARDDVNSIRVSAVSYTTRSTYVPDPERNPDDIAAPSLWKPLADSGDPEV